MKRRQWIGSTAATLAGVALMGLLEGDTPAEAQTPKDDVYAPCAKACADCEKACTACNKHCAAMVKAGMTEHEKSRQLSADCRELCAASYKIVSRKGPMSAAVCEACAMACDACGAECAKYPDMATMKACAVSCAVCAKACRTMIAKLKAKGMKKV